LDAPVTVTSVAKTVDAVDAAAGRLRAFIGTVASAAVWAASSARARAPSRIRATAPLRSESPSAFASGTLLAAIRFANVSCGATGRGAVLSDTGALGIPTATAPDSSPRTAICDRTEFRRMAMLSFEMRKPLQVVKPLQ